MKSDFFELASRWTWVDPTPEELEENRRLLTEQVRTPEDEAAFFDYCKQWKLAPWMRSQLVKYRAFDQFGEATKNAFDALYQAVLEQNQARNANALQVLHTFNEQGIAAAVLKGNYLAHEVYRDPGYKRMNDFDMLIHRADWDRIQDGYLTKGYIPLGFGWSGEKEKPAKFSHVGMSFISPDFKCILGSQWGLKSPTTKYNDCIDQAWETVSDGDFLGEPVKVLSTEFHLLHLILHMGIYKCGIRDCMDVYNLLRAKRVNPDILIPLLIKANAVEKAYFTLTMANLSAPGVADYILEKLQPKNDFVTKRCRKRVALHQRTGDYQTAYNDYFQDIEKEVIYFNLFPKFHLRFIFLMRIYKLIYFPKNEVVRKLNDKQAGTNAVQLFFLRIPTTHRIFSLIAQEIGWKFTLLIFVKLSIDWIVSLKNYFVPTTSYFDYLKSKNIDPKAIEKVVKNIQ